MLKKLKLFRELKTIFYRPAVGRLKLVKVGKIG